MTYEVLLLVERADAGEEALPPPGARELGAAIEHARDWPGAAAAVARARAAVRLVEALPSAERLGAFVARVAAEAARRPCVAVWWKPAGRLVAPEALAAAAREDEPLRVAVQVRLFHVEESDGDERVVDTLGLAPLGLPDVQCHFAGLDAAAVAALVDETARYLYVEGDVIEDGDTVEGIDGTPWACRHEAALVDPPRDVLDLAPPPAHAARRG